MITIQGTQEEELIERLSILFTTPKGTVCYDRSFGIDLSVLDLPLAIARVRYLSEIIEAVNRYETDIKVMDAILSIETNGVMKIKVVIADA